MIKHTSFILFFLLVYNLAAQNADFINFFLKGSNVTAICSDEQSIWIATNGKGIYKYSPASNKFINFSTENSNIQQDIFYSIAANDKFVWAGSTDGLFIYDKQKNYWTKRKFGLGGQLGNWIRALAYDKYRNVLWIGRFQYLSKYDLNTKRFFDYDMTINGNEKTNTIKTIAIDGDSLIWFGTEAGLHKYYANKDLSDPSSRVFYDNKLNFFNGEGEQVSISSIVFEGNNIWIGTDEFLTKERPEFNIGGIYKFNRKNEWHKFDITNGLPGNGVNALCRTGNYIWAALYQFGSSSKEAFGRGIVLINRLTNRVMPIRDEQIPSMVNCLFFDGTNMWIGTESNLVKIELKNKFATWNYKDK
ncbi:hypothetical protein ABRY23_05855 [Melioribacteraceae bacterium 4301-Me]|uniref:ligand-binding sensor domain-containing protein n=1 Tax=Pyranulibacter aquaticus TaxID=3163344 RepID=UPI0035995FF7